MVLEMPGISSKGIFALKSSSAFFAAPSENIGVPALETGNDLSFSGKPDQKLVDFMLGERVISRLFAHIYEFSVGAGVGEQIFAGKKVIDHGISRSRARSPFRVRRPGSPGPAPIRYTYIPPPAEL